jgi:hypothetical protein
MSLRAVLVSSVLMCAATTAYAACTHDPRIPTSRYEIKGDQVFDTETKLTWQRCSLGQQWKDGAGCAGTPRELTWQQARRQSGAWRLPTKDELLTLMSNACLRSANAEAFPGIQMQYPTYWSSTETEPNLTWTVNLTSGHAFNTLQTSGNAVMLVQGQQIAQAPQN